jgi:bla regulator protein BlaR1
MGIVYGLSCAVICSSLASQSPTSQPAHTIPAPQTNLADPVLPVYEVSLIRPATADGDRHVWTRLNTLDVSNMSLKALLMSAFDVPDDMIVGLPKWATDMRVDIQAKTLDEDKARLRDLTTAQRRAMMIALFEDRLGLKWHNETRMLPTYELSVASGGPKLEPTKSMGHNNVISVNDTRFRLTNVPVSDLAVVLSAKLGRPVVDKTALSGRYDIALQWSPDDAPPSENPNAPPPLLTALKEQLGLRVKPANDPVQVFVIDQLMQPLAN